MTAAAGVVTGTGRKWVAHAAFAAGLVVLLTLYWPSVHSLVHVWAHDGTFQYAFLIFPVSLFLVAARRHSLGSVPVRPSWSGAVGLGAVSGLWLLGYLVAVNLVQQFALIASLPLLVIAVYGVSMARALLFPLAYLFFALPLPVGDTLVGHLQTVTAHISVFFLQLTNIPVLLDHHLISTPHETWHVAQACSGIKFFIACGALGTLYAHLFYRRWRRRLIFVGAALIVPIVANGLRVYFTILIGETFGLQYASGTDHEIFGWQFFGTVLVLLFLAGWHWREAPAGAVTAVDSANGARRRSAMLPAVLALACLAAGPLLASLWIKGSDTGKAPASATATAPEVPGWQRVNGRPNPLGASFGSASMLQTAAYDQQGARVDLLRAVYLGIPHGQHDLLTYGHWFYNRKSWSSDRTRVIDLPGGHRVVSVQLRGHGQQRLLWYWYDVNGVITPSETMAKLNQAWELIQGRRLRSAAVSISARVGHSGEVQAHDALMAFVGSALPRLVPSTRQPDFHLKSGDEKKMPR